MQKWMIGPHLTILLCTFLIASVANVKAFQVTHPHVRYNQKLLRLGMAETVVEVCGFKDCRRAGGGKRLENQVKKVLEEKGLGDSFQVEGCDCQGECGYGPNLVVGGKLINGVKGEDAILKALGLQKE